MGNSAGEFFDKAQGTSPRKPLIRLGKFLLLSELGRGGMGIVYEARDTELDRRVALKMLLAAPHRDPQESAPDQDRFLREGRLSATLPKHPHIVGVHEAGTIDGRRYLAMEYVQGRSMSEWRKLGSITIRQQVAVLRDVALALDHAHEHGIIHRDLKPANVLIDESNVPHVTDFGLAKMLGQNVAYSLTQGDLVVGTPAYMSPEQCRGVKDLDGRTDIYAVGVMLYETLTGRLPFDGDTAVEIMVKASKDAAQPPSKITTAKMNPFLFKHLEAICLRAMARNAKDRYARGRDLAADLTRWLKGENVAVGAGGGKRLLRGLAAAAVVAALAAVGAVFMTRTDSGAPVPPPPAPAVAPTPAKLPKTPIDLLTKVDVEKDAVSGTWSRNEGVLVAGGKPARLQLPYQPPEEYDFRVDFTRESGNFCVNLILTQGGRPFALVMERRGKFGFERLNGKDYLYNPSYSSTSPLESGRVHSAVVEVRRDGLKAYLNGEPITFWQTNYSDLTMNPDWKLRNPSALGIGSWDSTVSFSRVEVLEVTGQGGLTRPGR